jgi:hypothetical protein
MHVLLALYLQRREGWRAAQRPQQIVQLKQCIDCNQWLANEEVCGIGTKHPAWEATAGIVRKPHKNVVSMPILLPLENRKRLSGERMPAIENSGSLRNVCIM